METNALVILYHCVSFMRNIYHQTLSFARIGVMIIGSGQRETVSDAYGGLAEDDGHKGGSRLFESDHKTGEKQK